MVQLFGFTGEVTVYLFLKTSMAQSHRVLAREVVTLNAQNNHQAEAKVRVRKDANRLTPAVYLKASEILMMSLPFYSCTQTSWTRVQIM